MRRSSVRCSMGRPTYLKRRCAADSPPARLAIAVPPSEAPRGGERRGRASSCERLLRALPALARTGLGEARRPVVRDRRLRGGPRLPARRAGPRGGRVRALRRPAPLLPGPRSEGAQRGGEPAPPRLAARAPLSRDPEAEHDPVAPGA